MLILVTIGARGVAAEGEFIMHLDESEFHDTSAFGFLFLLCSNQFVKAA